VVGLDARRAEEAVEHLGAVALARLAERVVPIPCDLAGARHLERAAIGPRADERVAVAEAMGARDEAREEAVGLGRVIDPARRGGAERRSLLARVAAILL